MSPMGSALSPTVLGWSPAWHPQGPIHPQPHPVPLHVVHPCSYPAGPSPGGGAVPRPVVARGGRVERWGPGGCQATRSTGLFWASCQGTPIRVRGRGRYHRGQQQQDYEQPRGEHVPTLQSPSVTLRSTKRAQENKQVPDGLPDVPEPEGIEGPIQINIADQSNNAA